MSRIDMCCSCLAEIKDARNQCVTKFRYQVPTLGVAEQLLTAVVCPKCAKDCDDPALFPVVEAMINTLIIRIENQNMLFTPEKRMDE